ncbi:MAG: inositol 2-dehydrogenase [Acidobacteriota bacterium]|nr:MAG: inositol 2-dehydrogenase [Acidobacteriota bacterium]
MRNLRVAVVGLGRIGKVHLETLLRRTAGVEVISVWDPRSAKAEEAARSGGIPSVGKSFSEILEADVDAVILCSPTDTHTEYVIAAARAGKHIFCEKPLALSLAEIRDAIAAVEAAGVQLMVGYNRRFDPNHSKARQMVETGKIGAPHLLKITSRDPAPPPPEYCAVSGGMFLDMTIHDFDLARYVMGSEVKEVFARATSLVDERIGQSGDVDTAVITLDFENGAIGVIDNSRRAVYGYDQRLEVFGSAGMVQIDNTRHDTHEFFGAEGTQRALLHDFFMDRYREAFAVEMGAFVESIRMGREVPVTGHDGLLSVAIALAAKKSVADNRPVHIDEV